MVSHLAQYVARSPRYILQPQDNTLIRIAGPQQTPWEEGTEIHNVSLSGLAFTAPADLVPMLGETIKIQFPVPGRDDLACMAIVIRIERLNSSTMLVAVKFLRLEMPARQLLAQALALKLRDQSDPGLIDGSLPTKALFSRKTRAGLTIAFAVIWMILMIWFCLHF